MQGIDFSMPVRATELTPGARYVQHVLDGRVGNYFAPVGTPAEMLGINPAGRVPALYTPSQPVSALQSTAAQITDTWTVRSQPF
jgi:beta-lactamase class A